MKSITQSKINHGSDAPDRSNKTLRSLGQKSTAPTIRQETPDYPLLGPPEAPRGAHKINFLKEYVLTLKAALGHLNTQPPREQHIIIQYKEID